MAMYRTGTGQDTGNGCHLLTLRLILTLISRLGMQGQLLVHRIQHCHRLQHRMMRQRMVQQHKLALGWPLVLPLPLAQALPLVQRGQRVSAQLCEEGKKILRNNRCVSTF